MNPLPVNREYVVVVTIPAELSSVNTSNLVNLIVVSRRMS